MQCHFGHFLGWNSQITWIALHLSDYLSIPLHLAAFVSTKTFADLVESLGPHGAFFLYGCVCIFGAIFTCIFLPETKGRSQNQPDPVQLREMQQYSTVPNQAWTFKTVTKMAGQFVHSNQSFYLIAKHSTFSIQKMNDHKTSNSVGNVGVDFYLWLHVRQRLANSQEEKKVLLSRILIYHQFNSVHRRKKNNCRKFWLHPVIS